MAGIKGMAWGCCQVRRSCEVEGGRGQGTGPVVAAISRKIVNTDWLEVDEGDLPVFVHQTVQKKWTDLFVFSQMLFS